MKLSRRRGMSAASLIARLDFPLRFLRRSKSFDAWL